MSEWHLIPAQFHPFKTVGNILLWRLFWCFLCFAVLCGLLCIIQDLPQKVGFSVTLMLCSRFLIARKFADRLSLRHTRQSRKKER